MNDMRGVFVLLMLLINIKVMDTSNVTCPDVCPRGKESWIKRGVVLKCVNSSSYHCIEIVEKGLCELCFPKFKVSDAGCPKLRWDQGSKQYYQAERNSECPVNIIGCPNPKLNYTSDELYKFPQCNGNNQSAIDETRSTQHIPPSTQPTEFTESLGNNTSSENGDDSTNHAAVISIVVVLVLAFVVGVLLLVCKRKALINWCMAKFGRRTSEAQTDGAMFKSNPSKKEKTSNSVTQETIVQIEESGRDNSVVGHPNEAANEATVPLLTNDKQTEEKKEHVVIQNTDSMGQSNSLSTNLKVNEIINGGTAQEKHIQLEASRNKNPTRHAFVETLRATYRKGWWVLRCKVSVEDIPCTWFRTHKNTDTEIHDGTEFKIFSIGTYRILHIQGSSGFDGRFRCELEDGSKEEIDVDFDETKTIQVKAGEACTLIRVMDETGMECKWLRNDDLIQRNEHFHIAMSNNESRLTIANVQSNDETTFRSKIGDEIQFYTIEIQDVEDSDSHHTLRKTLDDEDETTPKAIDVPHSEDAQHTVESNPPVRKIHEQHQELEKILGQVFCATEWDKITSLCRECATFLKKLPQPVFEKEDLRALRNIVRQSTIECQLCVADTFMTLLKILRNFDNIPEHKSIVGSGIQKEQKVSISTLIDFGKDFKTDTDDIIAKLKEKTKTFQNKIGDIENDIDAKKVYPKEKDSSIGALSWIAMNLTDIVKLLSNIKHSLSSLTNFLGNYVRVSPTPQEYSTLLPILRKMSKNVSKIDVLDSIACSLDEEFKEVYHKCNSPTRRNETQVDETEVNGDQQVLGEWVNVRSKMS